ncbi:hypothetical protein V9K67_26910, partial [Paraflavisolibacter sp. H34]|uniref:immunity protein Imm33 domain-containing protein n=1 Tax=Huijunlia imazamoxiresistens TaxID=3127457 RepID=UPI00301720BD
CQKPGDINPESFIKAGRPSASLFPLAAIVLTFHKVQENNHTTFDQGLWDNFVSEQISTCQTHGAEYSPVDPFQIVGLADDLSQVSFNGLRHPVDNSSGWFLWSGDYNDDDNFFKPYHIWHLMYSKPEVLKYLGLASGYRFLIDDEGYEDVWFDESLLLISGG